MNSSTEAVSNTGNRGTPHLVTVIVNGRPRQIASKELSFREVVALAYENPQFTDTIVYTVTFKRGHGHKPEGTLVDGEKLKPKEGMQIHVVRTDKS